MLNLEIKGSPLGGNLGQAPQHYFFFVFSSDFYFLFLLYFFLMLASTNVFPVRTTKHACGVQ